MDNDGFDGTDETGYSSDGYMFCQRDGCGRSIPWGRTPFTTRIAVRGVLPTMMGSGKPILLNVMQTTHVNVS